MSPKTKQKDTHQKKKKKKKEEKHLHGMSVNFKAR